MLEDQNVSILSHQTSGNAEKTSLLVVDKIIEVSEVACEKLETVDCNDKKLSHNFITEAEHSVGINNERW